MTLLMGCQEFNRQTVGSLAGGIIGGAIGTQIGGGSGQAMAIIGGTLLGSYIGGAIGKKMDDVDRMRMQQAINNNRTGQSTAWTNPDTGARYQVTPKKTYYKGEQPCREFQTTVTIGGKKEQMYGTACRQADGSWKQID